MTDRLEIVYRPVSELVACEMEGRVCVGSELNPAYADIIVKRWQEFTGQKAVLEADGRTFDEVAGERASTG